MDYAQYYQMYSRPKKQYKPTMQFPMQMGGYYGNRMPNYSGYRPSYYGGGMNSTGFPGYGGMGGYPYGGGLHYANIGGDGSIQRRGRVPAGNPVYSQYPQYAQRNPFSNQPVVFGADGAPLTNF